MSKNILSMILLQLFLLMGCSKDDDFSNDEPVIPTNPPFSGSIFIDPDIVLPSDLTIYKSVSFNGRGTRTVYDRREEAWITIEAMLFNALYEDGSSVEIRVNPEFETEDNARIEAEKYAFVVGQLPAVLRKDVQSLTIHKGIKLFGGGFNQLLIHTGQGEKYIVQGILEETLIHEAAHTSLDKDHAAAEGWKDAQAADPTYITTYAKNNSVREDIAESFLFYLALRYRSDRINSDLANTIELTIPNRVEYFDKQGFNMYPID